MQDDRERLRGVVAAAARKRDRRAAAADEHDDGRDDAPSRGPGNARPIECSASTTASPTIAPTSAARDCEAMNATAHSGITASAAIRQRPCSTAAIPAQNGTTSAHHRPSWWRLSNDPNSSSLPSL